MKTILIIFAIYLIVVLIYVIRSVNKRIYSNNNHTYTDENTITIHTERKIGDKCWIYTGYSIMYAPIEGIRITYIERNSHAISDLQQNPTIEINYLINGCEHREKYLHDTKEEVVDMITYKPQNN